jgi:hypothetical protein
MARIQTTTNRKETLCSAANPRAGRKLRRGAFAGASLAFLASAAAAWMAITPARSPADTIPDRLADTGLYADFGARVIAADVLAYEPQYPLWTDGAAKRRWIRLPVGASIDARDPDAWVFPRGTQLWKEFAFDHRVETRYMVLGQDGGWRFASYAWTADERDARLAPETGVRNACRSREDTAYDIPARTDCNACHAAGPNTVLGFSALQLSSDRDPSAPHARTPAAGSVDLSELVRRGIVTNLPQHLVDHPPRIEASSPQERAALGYLHGNCGMCHTSAGQLAALDLDLWTNVAVPHDTNALRTTVGHASQFRFAGDTDPLRIAPGRFDASVLVRRMSSRLAMSQMPPLGTHLADRDALDLIHAWIRDTASPAADGSDALSPTFTRSENR